MTRYSPYGARAVARRSILNSIGREIYGHEARQEMAADLTMADNALVRLSARRGVATDARKILDRMLYWSEQLRERCAVDIVSAEFGPPPECPPPSNSPSNVISFDLRRRLNRRKGGSSL